MGDSEHPPVYEFEGFRLDMRRRTLATLDGRAAPLPPKTLDALCHLVAHAGEVVGKRELLEAVWPHVVVEENNLNQAISQLRRALGERPNEHRYIVTEPGRGYRFVAAVSVARTEEVPSVDAPPAPRSEPSRRAVAVLAIATALAAGAAGLWWYAGQPPGPLPNSVAVLPFENLNPSPSNVAFASGLHGEIVSQLAKISSLIVIGASGEGPAREVAAELNVETVLHATVEFADGRVRIRPQLVSGTTGQTLWAQSYDERFADILAIESEIAAQVANALRAEFSVAEQTAVDTPPTESPEAYEAYVRARGVRAINPDLALQYLDEATQLDPGFALAYAAKAEQLAGRFIAQVGREAADPAEWDELERRIRAAANEALRIDGDLWLAHRALGDLEQRRWRWTQALDHYARAAAGTPRGIRRLPDFQPFLDLDFSAFIREQREIVALNPRAAPEQWVLGLALAYSRDAGAANVAFREAVSLAPEDPVYHIWLAHTEGMLGRHDEALRELRRGEQLLPLASAASISIVSYAYGYAQNGSPEDARRLFDVFAERATDRRHQAGNWALAYLAVGDVGSARAALEVVIDKIAKREPDAGYLSLRLIQVNMYADPSLDEPEFAALRAHLRGR